MPYSDWLQELQADLQKAQFRFASLFLNSPPESQFRMERGQRSGWRLCANLPPQSLSGAPPPPKVAFLSQHLTLISNWISTVI